MRSPLSIQHVRRSDSHERNGTSPAPGDPGPRRPAAATASRPPSPVNAATRPPRHSYTRKRSVPVYAAARRRPFAVGPENAI